MGLVNLIWLFVFAFSALMVQKSGCSLDSEQFQCTTKDSNCNTMHCSENIQLTDLEEVKAINVYCSKIDR